jgi:AcrR family transcriptional regulator
MARQAKRKIDRARRAQIGAERRSRTRAELLVAGLELFGRPRGRNTSIDDICTTAHVARGTFYNYFTGLEQFLESLSAAATRDFDAAVHAAFELLASPVDRASAAMRYYLHAALIDRRWGWTIVNTSVARRLYSEEITRHVTRSIQEGIDAGIFTIDSADVGRDILLGTGVSATISLLQGGTPPDYPERIARRILLSFGTPARIADAVTRRPLDELPRLMTNSVYFRGTLGGAIRAAAPVREPTSTNGTGTDAPIQR